MAAELTLIDALRLALSHNPAIRVQQQQLELTRAQEQQARGQFDWILSSSANHSREITPSPPSALTGESRVTASNYRLGLNKQLRTGLSMSGDINAWVSQNDAILGQAQQNRIFTARVATRLQCKDRQDQKQTQHAQRKNTGQGGTGAAFGGRHVQRGRSMRMQGIAQRFFQKAASQGGIVPDWSGAPTKTAMAGIIKGFAVLAAQRETC